MTPSYPEIQQSPVYSPPKPPLVIIRELETLLEMRNRREITSTQHLRDVVRDAVELIRELES